MLGASRVTAMVDSPQYSRVLKKGVCGEAKLLCRPSVEG